MQAMQAAEQQAALRTRDEQREYERAQVATHYENSPEVFSLVLDSALAYSTGIYVTPQDELEAAQQRKFAYIHRLLSIRPGERVLDVGCGWGSNLLYLASRTNAIFHGITLSSPQAEELLRRASARGLRNKVPIDLSPVADPALPPP